MTDVRQAVRDGIAKGWAPVPVIRGEKGPRINGWQRLRLVAGDVDQYFQPTSNWGVILGDASRWLVDVDLDVKEAIDLAARFLPATGAVFGREGKPCSHWLYYADGAQPIKIHHDKATLVELRASGQQTVFPGSVHPSGEPVQWVKGDEPARVDAQALAIAVRQLGEAAKLVRSGWSVDDACALAREGWATEAPKPKVGKRSQAFVEAVARYNAEHPRDYPRSGGDCPGCGHKGCFGTMPRESSRWYCFSSAHSGPGVRGSNGYHGDALDLAAYERGVTPSQLLRAEGYVFAGPERPDQRPERGGAGLPEILTGVDLERVADDGLEALAQSGAEIYQRGGILVQVVADEATIKGVVHVKGTPRFAPVVPARLCEVMASSARWLKYDARKGDNADPVPTTPPLQVVNAIMGRGRWPQLRRVSGITEMPVLRPDGSVVMDPGYDEATGLIYRPTVPVDVPVEPTKLDAELAAQALLHAVCDFPFASDVYKASWLAYALTPFARHAFEGPAPLFLVDANTRGTGKSLLAEVVGFISSGRPMPRMPPVDSDDEERKRITSLALSGDRLALLDNVTKIGSVALDAALTSTWWRDRVLGSTNVFEAELRTVFVATGNNVELRGDMCRRVCHIRIESPHERPEDRNGFTHPDLIAWVRKESPRLASAALTILRAYCLAGMPAQEVKTWGSYEGWNRLVAHAVRWVGLPDPNEARQELADAADTEKQLVYDFLKAFKAHATYGLTVKDLLEDIGKASHGGLQEAVHGLCPPKRKEDGPSPIQVGKRLARMRGRVIGGLFLDQSGAKENIGIRWVVREAK